MPKKTRAKCPEVPLALLEWLEKAVPEATYAPDQSRMAFDAGRRDLVLMLRHQYALQQKKDL